MTAPIVVIDYHKGNLSSVARGLARAGAPDVRVCDDPAAIRAASGLVLPGVGSFYDAISFMHEAGQDAAVLDAIAAGVPFLGVCLGMQLLFERGDEGVPKDAPLSADDAPGAVFEAPDADGAACRWVRGLGVLAGSSTRLVSARLKVPHVGWDQLHVSAAGRACPLLKDVPEGANVYFTHSFAIGADTNKAQVVGVTHYVRSFPAVVWEGRVFGCQFHPEKSAAAGLAILRNFVNIVRSAC